VEVDDDDPAKADLSDTMAAFATFKNLNQHAKRTSEAQYNARLSTPQPT
jgi:hypothetical protein